MEYIKGKIKLVLPVEEFNSGFYKQTLVITTEEKFPQDIAISFSKEKTELLKGLAVGAE